MAIGSWLAMAFDRSALGNQFSDYICLFMRL